MNFKELVEKISKFKKRPLKCDINIVIDKLYHYLMTQI